MIEIIVKKRNSDIEEIARAVKLSLCDFGDVKKFILSNHELLDDKTHFIVDDIDTLKELFNSGRGLVYGIKIGEKLIAVQAMDYNREDYLKFKKVFSWLGKKDEVMEIGWAMVTPEYQGNKLTHILMGMLERDAHEETGSRFVATTAHPHNISSLFVYLKNGYLGYKIKEHYDNIRMFLLKDIRRSITLEISETSWCDCMDIDSCRKKLDEELICCNVEKIGEQIRLVFTSKE